GEASSAVARKHARIDLGDDGATLTDLGSSNGTQLNGQLLDGPAPLHVGDRIQMGYTGATLTVLDLNLAAPPAVKAVAAPRVALIGAAAAAVVAAAVVAGLVFLRAPKAPPARGAGPPPGGAAAARPPHTRPGP